MKSIRSAVFSGDPLGLNYLKDLLGLPVRYEEDQFRRRKANFCHEELPSLRERIFKSLFPGEERFLHGYLSEAESVLESLTESSGKLNSAALGSPMGKQDRLSLYLAVRCFRPRVVVETGTAAGLSASMILSALERNGSGILHSIDLSNDSNIGHRIPESLRDRLSMHKGRQVLELTELLKRSGEIDFFLHDSDHSYSNMRNELRWAVEGGASEICVCSHDILMTNAWDHFVREMKIDRAGKIRNFGVCVFTRSYREGPS